ncbi:MAG: hypothetical protein ACTHZ7_15060 [Sphingobacterium sp.]
MLRAFFERAQDDPRMKVSHFGVYTALLQQWVEVKCHLPLETFGRITAEMAKVSLRTYYRCIRDLHDYNYLHYVPSYKNHQGSKVYLKWRGLGIRPEEEEELPGQSISTHGDPIV